MKNRPTTRPHVMLARFHLQNERRIFSSEECLASEGKKTKFCFNSRILFSEFFFIFPVMELCDCSHLLIFYAFVDIAICFFNADLSLLIRFSVIEVKQKKVVTVTSLRYSCETQKTFKLNSNIVWVPKNLRLTVSIDSKGSVLVKKIITHEHERI